MPCLFKIARHYPHMSDHLHEYDSTMKVILLIGRDLPEDHHVIEQRLGPPRFPFAQHSPLGWTIIGDVCLFGKHRPLSSESHQTFIGSNERPSGLKTCEHIITVRTTFINNVKPKFIKSDIFETTSQDKPGLLIEDRKFLDMENEFYKRFCMCTFRSP